MIDVTRERLYALKYARRWFPRRRRSKRPSLQTMYRWSSVGYHGIVLEVAQVGLCRCTSKAAVARFIERISALSASPEGTSLPSRAKSARQIDQALEEIGFDPRPAGSRTNPRCPRVGSEFRQAGQQASGSTGVTVRGLKHTLPEDAP